MSSLGYGAAGTMRGKKGDEASLWGRRGRSHAQSVPASPRFSANGTDGTWAKPGHPCPVPKETRGRAASLCWTWKVLLAILFFFEVLLYLYFNFFTDGSVHKMNECVFFIMTHSIHNHSLSIQTSSEKKSESLKWNLCFVAEQCGESHGSNTTLTS